MNPVAATALMVKRGAVTRTGPYKTISSVRVQAVIDIDIIFFFYNFGFPLLSLSVPNTHM